MATKLTPPTLAEEWTPEQMRESANFIADIRGEGVAVSLIKRAALELEVRDRALANACSDKVGSAASVIKQLTGEVPARDPKAEITWADHYIATARAEFAAEAKEGEPE